MMSDKLTVKFLTKEKKKAPNKEIKYNTINSRCQSKQVKNFEWSSMLAKCFYPKVFNDWDVTCRLDYSRKKLLFRPLLRHFEMIYGRLFM